MAKMEDGQIVESSREARGAEAQTWLHLQARCLPQQAGSKVIGLQPCAIKTALAAPPPLPIAPKSAKAGSPGQVLRATSAHQNH